ncbi:protein kinase (macronuclear) [Tetrahymena thermophila SB210]|uniref:Protein kinase n=1 Tax=Tetrahymena thermophila (strain SB210) TaxID=312017 RepID=Q24GH9_TETTS|nr:protein kinase [Tetrahymena thermophila SB210]EAS06892.3 protein kinase [Tetrahymena thermophila SB210]|eukprot:XP_001027134.3 protein kinase [Tetrahymena thermophila SB210]
MGNCCGDKNSGTSNSTLIINAQCQKIYQLESIDLQNNDQVFKYCEELKNLSHVNVKQISSFNVINGQLYISTHLNQETDLAKYMDSRKNSILPSQIAKFIIRQVCQGLQYLHRKEIVHGDLNLKNIEINPANNEIQLMNMSLPSKFQLKLIKNPYQMQEFESPEQKQEENISYSSDLYSLGVLALSLYGVSFQSTLKISKPVHCPFGLYEKLKALINQNPDSRPPIDDIIEALDFETNPESIQNIDQVDKEKQNTSKNSKPIEQNEDQLSLQSQKQKDQQTIHETNINAVIASQKDNQSSVNNIQLQQKSQNIIELQNNTSQQIEKAVNIEHKPISEKIILQKVSEKIEYDFNPYKLKQTKDQSYKNPMKTLHYYQDHESLITSIASDSTHNYIFTSSLDGSVIVYQFDQNQKQLKQHKKLSDFVYGVSQVKVTADNNYLIASDLSSNIYIYSLKDFKLFKKLTNLFEKSCILSIDISEDNQQLLISATYKKTLLCNLKNFEISKQQNIEGLSSNGQICRFFQKYIIIGEESGKILAYNQDNLITPIKEFNYHNNAITQISIGANYFAVSSQDKNISIFDEQLNKIQSISTHLDCVANVFIDKDCNSLTSNGWDGSTCLFLKNSNGQFELQSCFSNETSWSVSSIYIKKNNLIISSGGRFLFIFS